MPRVVTWSLVLVGSLVVVVLAFGSGGGNCVDSVNPAGSACMSGGAPFLLLVGVTGVLLSGAMLWRSLRAR